MGLPLGVVPLLLDVEKYGKGSEILFRPPLDKDKCVYPAILNWNKTQRFAIKVKCSDNSRYVLNPVFAFVEAESYIHVEIRRLGGEDRNPGKVVVQYAPVPPNDSSTSPLAFWQLKKPAFEELKIDLRSQD